MNGVRAPVRADPGREAATRPPVAAHPAPDAVGNQALQLRLRGKAAAAARLTAGRPDDAAEHEAERVADGLSGPLATSLPPGAPPSPPDRSGSLLSEPGTPLPAATRHAFEDRLGTDLSDVCVHRGPEAAAAEAVGAAAFAQGGDIAFAAGAPPPDSAAGAHLLAHEIGHLALGHAGLRRQTPPGTPPAAPAAGAPGLSGLGNADFLSEMAASHGASASAEHRAEVESERRRRVDMGFQWLTADIAATPTKFYRLVDAGGVDTAVVPVDAAVALGPPEPQPAPILSAEQFHRRLIERGIQTVAASTLAQSYSVARTLPETGLPTVRVPGERGGPAPYVIVDPVTAPEGLRTVEVRVPLGHQLAPTGEVLGADPSALPEELLIRMRAGTLTAEELTLLLQQPMNANDSLRLLIAFQQGQAVGLGSDTYVQTRMGAQHGFVFANEGSGGVGRALLGERMVRALRAGLPMMELEVGQSTRPVPGAAPEAGGPTAVERFHADIHRMLRRPGDPPRAGEHYWIGLREMAQLATQMGGAATPEEAALIARIAAGDAAALTALRAMPTPVVDASQVYRARLQSMNGPGFWNQFQNRMGSPYTPELAAAQQYGPSAATARAAGFGAGAGAVLALGIDATRTAAGNGDWSAFGHRAGPTALLGGIGGGVSMSVEQALVARTSSALIAEGILPGLASGVRLLGARTVGGGVGAGVVELVLIYGFEDRPHSTGEVLGRTGRATAIGLASAGVATLATAGTTSLIGAILATGGTGAVAGTVVPGWGNAIGFVVGIGAGVLTYVILDAELPRVEP